MWLKSPHLVWAVIDWSKYVPSIITLLGGGGFLTAVVLLLKARPEMGQIVVTSAQGAVIVQTGVIENLNRELKRVNDENGRLLAKLERETEERRKLQEALRIETAAMEDLRERFVELEMKLKELTTRTTDIEKSNEPHTP